MLTSAVATFPSALLTYGRVAAASVTPLKRVRTDRRLAPPMELLWRTPTEGCVFGAGGVAKERLKTGGRVVDAGSAAKKRLRSDGCVFASGCAVIERFKAHGGVVVAGGIAE